MSTPAEPPSGRPSAGGPEGPPLQSSERGKALSVLLAGACIIGLAPILVRWADAGPAAIGFWRLLLSLPLLMALWYAPLLVYFNDMGALAAMKSSLFACAKNIPAMLVYGLAVMAGLFLTMPFAMALRQYDLAIWLLAPVLLTSMYMSYKDIYLAGAARQPVPDSVAG